MKTEPTSDDPEPAEPAPAGPLYVPVRPGRSGCGLVARLFRTPLGTPTAVGFTSRELLASVLGSGQVCVPLAESALRDLVRPLGVGSLVVDPRLAVPAAPAPAPSRPAAAPSRPAPGPAVPAATGAHARHAVGVRAA